MKLVAIAALTVGLLAGSALAQTPRKPGAEEARIAYFVGVWKIEGDVKSFPGWPAGRFSSTEICEWFTGEFHLVCRSEGTSPMGPVKAESIFSYTPNTRIYTHYRISSLGNGQFEEGTVSGNAWTWTSENKVNGRVTKGRVTMTEQAPTTYASKTEFSVDGGPWTVIEEMIATKTR
jgi:hypothetical protein